MTQAIPDPAENAFRAFIRTSGLVRNRMDPYFARHGISAAQWGVLRALHRAEGEGLKGLQLNKLGQRLLVRPPSITSILDRLERVGLVLRQSDPDDQRAKLVVLTPSGHELLARVLVHHPTQIRSIMSCLNKSEQQEFHRLLDRLASHLEAQSNVAATDTTPCVSGETSS